MRSISESSFEYSSSRVLRHASSESLSESAPTHVKTAWLALAPPERSGIGGASCADISVERAHG